MEPVTPPTLAQIYSKIDNYLMLPDKGIVKLLMAFVIGCKLPTEPPWLFIASGSSTGKTQLVILLEMINGYTAVDDLSGNALMSGMKRHDTNASLLHRLPKNGAFLVFSDFTVMLSKHKEELSKILGQLRVVFDGKMTKHTGGQIETDTWDGKAGLLAASTDTLYTKTEEYAEVGQRMVIFHLPQPNNYEVGRFRFKQARVDRKAVRKELQTMVRDYLNAIKVPIAYEDLPEFDEQTQQDILDIGHLTVTARSPVPRNQYSREKEQTGSESKEGIGRVQGQLMTMAYGLMLQNPDHKLNDEDRRILYKVGLDSINPDKRKVLQTLAQYTYGGDLEQIAEKMGYVKNVTERFVDDLYALGMMDRTKQHFGGGSKYVYRLKDEFVSIMTKFEGIKPEEKGLPPQEGVNPAMGDVPPKPVDPPPAPEQLGF